MSIGDEVFRYRLASRDSQLEVAMKAHMDRAIVSKIERNKMPVPDLYMPGLSRVHYAIAMEIAEQKTDNFVPNVLDDGPQYRLDPSSVKERVMDSLKSLYKAYDGIPMYGPAISQAVGRKLWHANRKALEWLLVNQGKIEETFHLDGKELANEHEQMNKREEDGK